MANIYITHKGDFIYFKRMNFSAFQVLNFLPPFFLFNYLFPSHFFSERNSGRKKEWLKHD